jgi:hypothetical protein
MSRSTKIIGLTIIALSLLWAISMRHWGEVFPWIIALGTWYMACLQQSRIDEAQRKIEELQKQLGSKSGDLGEIAETK